MNVLHILKSEPDQLVQDLKEKICQTNQCKELKVYSPDTDWNQVVDEIFAADKVICWW